MRWSRAFCGVVVALSLVVSLDNFLPPSPAGAKREAGEPRQRLGSLVVSHRSAAQWRAFDRRPGTPVRPRAQRSRSGVA